MIVGITPMNKNEYLISQETLKIVLKSLEDTKAGHTLEDTKAGHILRREIERQDQDPDTSIIDLCLSVRTHNIFAKKQYCYFRGFIEYV